MASAPLRASAGWKAQRGSRCARRQRGPAAGKRVGPNRCTCRHADPLCASHGTLLHTYHTPKAAAAHLTTATQSSSAHPTCSSRPVWSSDAHRQGSSTAIPAHVEQPTQTCTAATTCTASHLAHQSRFGRLKPPPARRCRPPPPPPPPAQSGRRPHCWPRSPCCWPAPAALLERRAPLGRAVRGCPSAGCPHPHPPRLGAQAAATRPLLRRHPPPPPLLLAQRRPLGRPARRTDPPSAAVCAVRAQCAAPGRCCRHRAPGAAGARGAAQNPAWCWLGEGTIVSGAAALRHAEFRGIANSSAAAASGPNTPGMPSPHPLCRWCRRAAPGGSGGERAGTAWGRRYLSPCRAAAAGQGVEWCRFLPGAVGQ